MTDDSNDTADASCGQRDRGLSRRALLGAGGLGLASLVAGCSSLDGSGSPSGGPESDATVFTDISFEGQQMVVQLQEDHSVERLNLIGPEGSEYATSTVNTGETRVAIQIIRLSSGRVKHYTPGIHEILAVTGEGSVSTQVSLSPSIEPINLRWISNEGDNSTGNIVFDVKNTGTAPTWVYRIFYRDVPNKDARDGTGSKANPTLALARPASEMETIVAPGETQEFVGQASPLIFSEKPQCNGEQISGTALIDSPVLEPHETEFTAELTGERVVVDSGGFSKSYSCGEVSLEVSGEGNADG